MTENMTTQHESATTEETAPAGRPVESAAQDEYPGTDADAGTDEAAVGGPSAAADQETEDVLEALRDVVDPELGINVVDLGLVYGVTLDAERNASIDMTLTSAACPLTDVIEDQAREALEGVVSDFRINWVWLPPWGPEHITEDGREQLRALGFNL